MYSVSPSAFCSSFTQHANYVRSKKEPLQIDCEDFSLIVMRSEEYRQMLEAIQSLSQKAEESKPAPIIYTSESLKPILIPICEKYGIKRMSVFGSTARGEATAESDVDLIIATPKNWSLLSLIAFREILEDALKRKADVITEGIEDKQFLERIKKDEVLIYERQG